VSANGQHALRISSPTAWAGVVPTQALLATQTRSPTAVLAGMQVVRVAALWALAAAAVFGHERRHNGSSEGGQQNDGSSEASDGHLRRLLDEREIRGHTGWTHAGNLC
jgi:hypothetical protein